VRERILIAAAIVTGCWLGACSKPTSPNGQQTEAAEKGSRQIELADPGRPDGAVVSDLEAGRATERALVLSRRGAPAARATRAAASAETVVGTADQAVLPAPAPVHPMSMTTSSMPDAALRLATAPLAPVPVREGDASVGGGESHPMSGGYPLPEAVNRGPTIILRGGRGGPDDDCDLRNQHGHRGGAAVNRLAPPMGGSRISFRGGIR
jgi:hypothetical protein